MTNETLLALARGQVLLHREMFWPDFYDWLNKNFPIYEEFDAEATKIRSLGKSTYGHRTIWEHIRHETTLREVDSEFKMNDHYTKSCARLYLMLHPDAKQFFRFREDVSAEDMARAA